MSYLKKYLIDGETVLYTTRLHWIVLGWHLFFSIVFVCAGLYALIGGGLANQGNIQQQIHATPQQITEAGVILLLVGAAIFTIGWIKRNATVMIVTNQRVLVKIGYLTRRTWEMAFSKIESVGVEEPMMGRMLGYGSIIIRGVGGTPEPFHKIAHPLEFRRQVQQQIEHSPSGSSPK